MVGDLRQLLNEIWIWALVLALALLVLFGGLILVRRLLGQPLAQAPRSGDELTNFRAMYERGELTKEEYDHLRSKLGKRLREELDMPTRQPEKSVPPEPPPPGPPTA